MLTSFYSGLTGLSAYASALNIVGNNLANVNTAGFKASSINFKDLVAATFGGLATSGSGNPMQVGLGVLPTSIDGIFTQGSIQNTTEATNVAIEGNGFFIVGDTEDEMLFTRAGNFSFDREGYLINPAGQYVLGYTDKDADGSIISSGTLHRIFLPANTISEPEPTTFIQLFANLNVQDDAGDVYTASVTIYDSKGAPHTLSVEFTHNPIAGGNDAWDYEVFIPGEDVVGGTAGTPYSITGGPVVQGIQFDATGTMVVPAADVALTTPAFVNGADPLNFNWDLLYGDNDVPTLTGYPFPSATNSTNTDGYGPGNLTSIIVGSDGIIQGIFSNGQVEELAQLALATFNNPRGLLRVGGNIYAETNASGNASVGAPDTGGRGTISGSALESSNVDIATEFTNMMVFQRGYQANSRIITTSDEVIQESLNIKR
jgi:flagellar hook protein FlgE